MTEVKQDLLERHFHIRKTNHPGSVFCVTLSDLLEKEKMEEFIQFYSTKLKAKTKDVAATYFFKYFGSVLAGVQYMLSFSQSFLLLDLKKVELQVFYHVEYHYYGLIFKLHEETELICSNKNRIQMKKEIIEKIYEDNVVPLLEAFVETTNIRNRDLWGQLSLSLYYGHDLLLELADTDEQKQTVLDDFTFLTKEVNPKIFHLLKNPLDITFTMLEIPNKQGEYYRMKPSCCLYYLTEDAKEKCYTCPRINKFEREKIQKEISKK